MGRAVIFQDLPARVRRVLTETEDGHWLTPRWPGKVILQVRGRRTSIRALVMELAGHPAPPGQRWKPRCGESWCCRPEHQRSGLGGHQARRAGYQRLKLTPERLALMVRILQERGYLRAPQPAVSVLRVGEYRDWGGRCTGWLSWLEPQHQESELRRGNVGDARHMFADFDDLTGIFGSRLNWKLPKGGVSPSRRDAIEAWARDTN